MWKALAAVSARIRADFCVASHMDIQCIRATEFPTAYIASEIVDVIMNLGMVFHLMFCLESNKSKE